MRAWKKVPSVTTGGKAYFWYSAQPSRVWIVWDRQLECWTIRLDGGALISQKRNTKGWFSPTEAKMIVHERGL